MFDAARNRIACLSRVSAVALAAIFTASAFAQTIESGAKIYPTGATTISAVGSLNTANSLTVPSGANVTYQATGRINLEPGFSVTSGGAFHAQIVAVPAPSSLAASNVTTTSFTLQWASGGSGISAYEVQRDGVSLGTTAGTTMTVSGLLPGASCSITVRAQDSTGNWSAWSTPLSVSTVVDTTPPSIPSGFSVTSLTGTSFVINWLGATDNSGVSAYDVALNGTSLGTVTSLNDLVTGLAPNTRYTIQVRAQDLAGNWSAWSDLYSVVTPAGVLTLVSQTTSSDANGSYWLTRTYTNGTSLRMQVNYSYTETYSDPAYGTNIYWPNQSVILSPGQTFQEEDWTNVYPTQGYTEHRLQTITSTQTLDIPVITSAPTVASTVSVPLTLSLTANNSPTSFSATGLPPGLTMDSSGNVSGTPTTIGTYNVAVSATNSYGTGYATVAWTIAADSTPPTAPTNVAISSFVAPSFGLTWSASTDNFGVTGYQVFVNGTSVGTFTSSPATITFAYPDADYTITVCAFDAAGNLSAPSAPVTVHSTSLAVGSGAADTQVSIPGSQHQIVADPAPLGQYFAGWVISGPGSIDLPKRSHAVFTAGSGDTTITATYAAGTQIICYDHSTLDAEGGQAGQTIGVHAPAQDPAGYIFVGWANMGFGVINNAYSRDASVTLAALPADIWVEYYSASNQQPLFVSISAPQNEDVNMSFQVFAVATCYTMPFTGQSIDYSLDGGINWNIGMDNTVNPDLFWRGTSAFVYGAVYQQQLRPYLTFTRPMKVAFRTWAEGQPPNVTNVAAYGSTQISVPGTISWAPTNLRIVDAFDSRVTFTWDPAPGAPADLSYEMYLTGDGQSGVVGNGGSTTEMTIGYLKPNTPYTFKVRARNWTDVSAWSNDCAVTTLGPPVINSASTASGTVGAAFQYQLTATNSPTSYSMDGTLPQGLTFSTSTGLISGTPTTTGSWAVTLHTANSYGDDQLQLVISVINAGPVISSSPQSQTVNVGQSISLSVAAAGTPPLTYRWQKNGTDISGATTATLTLSNIQLADLGDYVALVTNNAGTTASAVAHVTLTPAAPVITSYLSIPATVGVPITYTIQASNSPTAYQATTLPPGITLTGAKLSGTPTATGTYSTIITASNSVGSDQKTLVWTITSIPQDGTVASGLSFPESDGTVSSDYPTGWPNGASAKTDVVAYTHVDFSVNASGEATARVPITVTPGVAGLQPDLALTYNHNGGNGYLGIGWALQGVPIITRRPGTLATDGAISPITLTASDHYALDGQKLIRVADDVTTGSTVCTEYRTEIDGYSRILAYSTVGSTTGPDYFVVETKAGLKMTFGSTTDPVTGSRIMAVAPGSTTTPVAWAIDTLADRSGNQIGYSYTKNATTGEFYISSIKYLGSQKAQVKFSYDDRSDPTSGFVGGAPWARTKYLTKIESMYDQSDARAYVLSYETSPNTSRSRLHQIQEFDANGNGLPAVTFDYKAETSGWSKTNESAFWPPEPLSIVRLASNSYVTGQTGAGMIDLDGDGIPDFLHRHGYGETELGYIAKGSPTGWINPPPFVAGFNSPRFLGTDAANNTTASGVDLGVRFVDLNSDGYPDMIVSRDYDMFNESRSAVFVNTPNGWAASTQWDASLLNIGGEYSDPDRGVRFVDLDGDGRVDVIWSRYESRAGIISGALRNTGSGWEKFPDDPNRPGHSVYDPPDGMYLSASIGASHQPESGVQLIDINGDGLVDIVCNWPNVISQPVAYLNTGHGWSAPNYDYAPKEPIAFGGAAYEYGVQSGTDFIDVNGDGLPDQVAYRVVANGLTGSSVYVATWLNTGAGWMAAPTQFNLKSPLALMQGLTSGIRFGVVFTDVNGDGLIDMVTSTSDDPKANVNQLNTAWQYPGAAVYLNTGNGWVKSNSYFCSTAIASIANDAQGPAMGTQILDIDGNGMPDVVMHFYDPDHQVRYQRAFRNMADRPDLLQTITYSSGLTTGITYATLAQNAAGFYTKGDRSAPVGFPFVDKQDSRYVVKQVTEKDGIGGSYNLDYTYNGLRENLIEGGAGFASVTVTDSRTSKATTTYYRQDFPFVGLPWKVDLALSSGRIVNSTATTWAAQKTFASYAPRVRAPYAQITEQDSFDPDSTSTSPYLTNVATVNQISDWGDATDKSTETNDGYATSETRKITYASATDAFPGQIQDEIVTVNASTQAPLSPETKTRTTAIHYDSLGRVDTETQEPLTTPNATSAQVATYLASDYAKSYYLVTQHHYDSYGNTDWIELSGPGLSAPRRTSFTYSSTYEGRFLTSKTDALSHTETYSGYDNTLGVPATYTDANLLPTTFVYDGLGRVTMQTNADNIVTRINRRWVGSGQGPALAAYHVETLTTARPPSLVFFDQLGRPLRTVGVSPDGKLVYTDTFRDTRGNAILTTRPYFVGDTEYGTLTEYDALGRIKKETYEGLLSFDGAGNLSTVTSAIGASTFTYSNFTTTETRPNVSDVPATGITYLRTNSTIATERNSLGKIVDVVETGTTSETGLADATLSAENKYTYDGFGALETILDPIKAKTQYSVDAYGRRTTAVDPNRGTWQFQYDPLGELVKQTDANSKETDFVYDVLGRTTSRTIDGATTTWTYDTAPGKGIGKLASIASFSDVNEAYQYGNFGELTTETVSLGASSATVTYTRNYGYDAFMRLKTIAHVESGFTERHVYSEYGYWVASRNDATGGRYWLGSEYEADGRVRTILYGNGLKTQRVYREDEGGVLDSVRTGTDAAPDSAQYLQYFYEPGRIGSVYMRLDFNHHLGEGFTYDALNRLHRTYLGTVTDYTAAINTPTNASESYDAAGNLQSKDGVGAYNYFATSEWGAKHGAHAVKSIGSGSTYTYDNNGNILTADDMTATWTAFDQPATLNRTGANQASFTYGPDLQRIRQVHGTETTDYVGAGHEHRTTTTGTDEHIHYLIGPFGRMGEVTYRNGQYGDITYFHHDHLGSVDTMTKVDGSVVQQSYDPWGERRSDTTWKAGYVVSAERRGFSDHEELDDLKLINMNGRVYDAHLGRFLSVDPAYDRMYKTQGLNAYSYVRNNPVSYTDPTGLADDAPVKMDTYTVTGYRDPQTPGLLSTSFSDFVSRSVVQTAVRVLTWFPRADKATETMSFVNGGIPEVSSQSGISSSDPSTPDGNVRDNAQSAAEFLSGIAAGYHQDVNPFASEVVPFSVPNKYGLFVGHAIALYQGMHEMDAGGSAVAGSGFGELISGGTASPVAIPAAAAGTAVAAHGTLTGLRSLQHMLKMDMQNSRSGSPVWTSAGGKHVAPKNVNWNKIVKGTRAGPAKYKPGINIEALERDAWSRGASANNGRPWRIMEFLNVIGASGGAESRWIRVEESAGTIHGHPITEVEFNRLTK